MQQQKKWRKASEAGDHVFEAAGDQRRRTRQPKILDAENT